MLRTGLPVFDCMQTDALSPVTVAGNAKRPTLLFIVGLTPQHIGGMLVLTREICARLEQRGWNTVVAWEGPASSAVKEYFAGLRHLRFEVLPSQEGFRWEHVGKLRAILARHRPDQMVYAFNGILRLFPWVARLAGVRRIVYYDHSSRAVGFTPRRWSLPKRLIGRFLCRPISKVTSVSRYTAGCLATFGIFPEDRIAVVYNSVETGGNGDGAAFREKLGIPGDRFLVVQVSWLVPEKGIDILLHAAARILQVEPNTHFAVIGSGPCQGEYERLAQELGIAARVTFTRTVLPPMAEGAYAAADVCCQFSQWEEAFGVVIAEAMIAGRPVVASRVGGIPEIVIEGETGFLVDRRTAPEAADCILQLLRDPALRARMGEAGRRRALELFDLQRNVERLLTEWGIE